MAATRRRSARARTRRWSSSSSTIRSTARSATRLARAPAGPTFHYGPGNTRMSSRRESTLREADPVWPVIALDRERCILCYRCTRFSFRRGRGQPARGAVISLPIPRSRPSGADPYSGAVLGQRDRAVPGSVRSPRRSTASRRGRGTSRACRPSDPSAPWAATSTRRRVKARSSASSPGTTPRSTAAGSATRAASRTAISREDHISEPILRGAAAARGGHVGAALDRAEELLRGGRTRRHRAVGLGDGRAGLCARQLLRRGLGSQHGVFPEAMSDELDAFRVPLSSLAEAEIVVLVADDDHVTDRAPVVDLGLQGSTSQRRRDRARRP